VGIIEHVKKSWRPSRPTSANTNPTQDPLEFEFVLIRSSENTLDLDCEDLD